jgi:hypothetical protein
VSVDVFGTLPFKRRCLETAKASHYLPLLPVLVAEHKL